jgi:hypothetical protein
MALQVCKKCTTRYAPAAACPNCGGEEWVSELEADEQAPSPDAGKTPAPPAAADEEGPPDYASYPVGVLRDLARERGITQHGAVKADLVAALVQWDADHPDGDTGPGPDAPGGQDGS